MIDLFHIEFPNIVEDSRPSNLRCHFYFVRNGRIFL